MNIENNRLEKQGFNSPRLQVPQREELTTKNQTISQHAQALRLVNFSTDVVTAGR